ncbi:MAG: VWA domain-containing protein [Treponema sp.]|jgi:hypothetical protein|nr:VWA domain-containing protein [Treponema sp.]
MKKDIIALILVLGAFLVYGQNAGPIDLILLLDTSASMSDSYEDVQNYISGAFLKEFLRAGDTFHLIPFSDKPRVDFARRFEGRGELETIIGRMFLQYPLDPWSDIPAALSFAESYAASLPSRPKKIVLVSDGDSAPPPGSASRSYDEAGLTGLINETKTRLGGKGIDLYYTRINPGKPLANLPGSERTPLPQAAPAQPARAPDRPASPTPSVPRPAPSTPPAADRPAAQTPDMPQAQAQATQPAQAPGAPPAQPAQAPDRPASSTPSVPPPAPSTPPATDRPAARTPDSPPPVQELPSPAAETVPPAGVLDDAPVEVPPAAVPAPPPDAPPVQTPPAGAGSRLFGDGLPLPLLIGIAVLGLLAAGLVIFLVTRRLQGSPNRAMAMAAAPPPRQAPVPLPEENLPPFKDHSRDLASFAASRPKQRTTPYADHRPLSAMPAEFPSGPVLLNLFVEDQNTFIGRRNIHALKSGYSFTVGGGKSDFLIFLVPVPAAIGEVRRDGNSCTFIPRKPAYFPDLGSRELPDCIGKTIRVVSDKEYELRFRVERWEDPLLALNRLLNSIKVPGLLT